MRTTGRTMVMTEIPGGPPSIDRNYPFRRTQDILRQNPELKALLSDGDFMEGLTERFTQEKIELGKEVRKIIRQINLRPRKIK